MSDAAERKLAHAICRGFWAINGLQAHPDGPCEGERTGRKTCPNMLNGAREALRVLPTLRLIDRDLRDQKSEQAA